MNLDRKTVSKCLEVAFLKQLEPRDLEQDVGNGVPKKFTKIGKGILREKSITTTKGMGVLESWYGWGEAARNTRDRERKKRSSNNTCNYEFNKEKIKEYVTELSNGLPKPMLGYANHAVYGYFNFERTRTEPKFGKSEKYAKDCLKFAQFAYENDLINNSIACATSLANRYIKYGLVNKVTNEEKEAFANASFLNVYTMWKKFTGKDELPLILFSRRFNTPNSRYIKYFVEAVKLDLSKKEFIKRVTRVYSDLRASRNKDLIEKKILSRTSTAITVALSEGSAAAVWWNDANGVEVASISEEEKKYAEKIGIKIDVIDTDISGLFGWKVDTRAKEIQIDEPGFRELREAFERLPKDKPIKIGRLRQEANHGNLPGQAQKWIKRHEKDMPCITAKLIEMLDEDRPQVLIKKQSNAYGTYTIFGNNATCYTLAIGKNLYSNFLDNLIGRKQRDITLLWRSVFGGHYNSIGVFAHVRFVNVFIKVGSTWERAIIVEELQSDALKDNRIRHLGVNQKALQTALKDWDYLALNVAIKKAEAKGIKHILFTPESVQKARWSRDQFIPETYESLPRKIGFKKIKVQFAEKAATARATQNTQNRTAYKIVTETISNQYCEGQFWYRSTTVGETDINTVRIRRAKKKKKAKA